MSRCLAALVVIAAACGEDQVFVDAPPTDAPVDTAELDAPDVDATVDAPDVDATVDAPPVLTAPTTFTVALGTLCGIGYNHLTARVWIYPCSGATVHGYTADGTPDTTLPRPGEAADDADIAFAPAATTIGTTAVAAGAMLFINGETAVAEIHLPDTAQSTPLVTAFGASHVVGGAYHPARQTLFLVQDRNAGATGNTVAEIDRASGALLGSFSTAAFDVNYGDLEVCPSSGNLFVVSSVETTIAELTPAGASVGEYALPAGVTSVSGLALGPDGTAWLVGTGGQVWRLAGLPCNATP